MKLKYILQEANEKGYPHRSTEITQDYAINLLLAQCRENLAVCKKYDQYERGVFRGITNHDAQFLYIEPSLFNRSSANTHFNYYTLLMDNLPEWKQFPKRSKSIICTTEKQKAKSYGDVYQVIPYDHNKFGVCPEQDVWESFSFLQQETRPDIFNMNMFNNLLNELFFRAGYLNEIETYAELYKAITVAENKKEEIRKDLSSLRFAKEALTKLINSKSIFDTINDWLDPNANRFKLVEFADLIRGNWIDREVWTASNCILISETIFSTIKSQLYEEV